MISFVYFDVGGVVIVDISKQDKWNEYKKSINIPLDKYDEFDNFWDKYDPQLNTTKKVDELIPLIEDQFGIKFPIGYSIQTELAKTFKKNESIWPVIGEIKNKSRIGLLTNMYPEMLNTIKSTGIMPEIDWELIVDSSIVGYQKPDNEIYEVAEKLAGVNGNEILFIDNSQRNVDGAKDFGWNAILYDASNTEESNRKVLEYFNNL